MPPRTGRARFAARALVLALAALGVVVFLVFQTTAGATLVLRASIGSVEETGLNVDVGGLGWSPPWGVTADDVRISDAWGGRVFEATGVALDPQLGTLLGEGPIVIANLRVTDPHVVFMDRPNGWGSGLSTQSDSTDATSRGPAEQESGRSIQINRIEIEGARIDVLAEGSGRGAGWSDTTVSLTRVDAHFSDLRLEPSSGPMADFEIAGGRVRLGAASPAYALFLTGQGRLKGSSAALEALRVIGEASKLSGTAALDWGGDGPIALEGELATDRLSPREIRGFAPTYPGEAALEMRLAFLGDLDSLAVDLVARPRTFRPAGSASGQVVLRQLGTRGLRWNLALDEFEPGALAGGAFPIGRTTAQLTGDVHGEELRTWHGTLHAAVERSSVAWLDVGPSDVQAELDGGLARVAATIEAVDAAGSTSVRGEGDVAPFDSLVALSLAGTFERVHTRVDQAPLIARGTFDVDTRGTSVPTLTGNARVSLDPSSPLLVGEARLTRADVAVALHGGAGEWGLDAGLEGGDVNGRGVLTIGDAGSIVTAESLTWSDVDLAAVLGDTVPSQLSGTGRATVEIGSPNGFRGDGVFHLASFEYGAAAADSASVAWRIEPEEHLFASLSAWRSTGSLTASLEARRPFDPVRPVFQIEGTLVDVPLESAFRAEGSVTGRASARFSGSWEGRSPETATARGDLTLLPSTIQGADSVTGTASATLDGGVVALEAHVDGSGGRFQLAGQAEPFRDAPTWALERAEFARVDLALWVPASAPSTYLTGRVAGAGTGFEISTFEGQIRAVLDSARVGSSASGAGEILITGEAGRADVSLAGRIGSSRIDGSGWFSAVGDEPDYSLDLALRSPEAGDAVQAGPAVQRAPLFVVELRGSGVDPETMVASLRARADSVDWLGLGIDSLRIATSAAGGVLTLDTTAAWGTGFSLNAGGQLALHESATHDATAALRLESFRSDGALLPTSFAVGTGEVSGFVRGPFRSAEAGATVSANAMLIGGTLQLVGLNVSGTAALDGLTPRIGDLSAEFSGLTTPDAAVQSTSLTAAYDGELIALDIRSVVDARRTLAVTARGDPRADRREILLEEVSASLDGETWSLMAPASIRFASGVAVDSFDMRAGDRRIFAAGSLSSAAPQDFRASVSGFEVGTLADLVGFDQLTGVVSGDLSVSGTASDPELAAGWVLQLEDPQLRPILWSNDLSYRAGVLTVQDELLQDGRAAVSVAGTVPVLLRLPWQADTTAPTVSAAQGPVAVQILADSASIAWLQNVAGPLGYGGVDGTLHGRLQVSGSADEPQLGGNLRLAGGRVNLTGLGTAWTGIGGTLVLNDTMVVVEGGLVRSGGGILRANGTAHLDDLTVGALDVSLAASSFRAVDNALATATISGTTMLRGSFQRPELSGTLRVPVADVYLTGLEAGAVRDVTLSDADYEELRALFGRDFRSEETGFALVDSLTLALNLDVGRDTWVRQSSNPELAIQVDGLVRVEKTPGDSIRLFGEMDAIPERSYVEQFGRRFSLDRGRVAFRGRPRETQFDVLGIYAVPSARDSGEPEVRIELGIDGTVERLNLVLSSDPSMDNSDIVSYLATGRPASQDLGLGQTAFTDLGTDLALDAVTSSIETAAAQSVGLDVVEVDPDGLNGATLVAGRYVSPRIFVGFRQPVSWDSDSGDSSEGGARAGRKSNTRRCAGFSSTSRREVKAMRYAFAHASPTERPRATAFSRIAAAASIAISGLTPGVAVGQAPLFLVDESTVVSSVGYSFPGGRSLEREDIDRETVHSDPGFWADVQDWLDWLPFVSPPEPVPFDPVELQKDVVRLREFYAQRGFPRADVSYAVQLDSVANAVDIRFVVEEGAPLLLEQLDVQLDAGSARAGGLPADLTESWARLVQRLERREGERLGTPERQAMNAEALQWARDRGFAFAAVVDSLQVDTAAWAATLAVELDPGPRAQVDSILIEGNDAISRGVLTRELPFQPGDLYSAADVSEGQRQIFGLDLIRLALADVPEGQPRDSTATVRYRVEEGPAQSFSAETGYSSATGINARADWVHRDFLGSARTLSAMVESRSALLSFEGAPERSVGGSITLRQPYLFDHRVSGTVSPFAERRNGTLDRSWEYGVGFGLLWERGPFAMVSLDYRIARREILELRAGPEDFVGLDFLDAVAALDSLKGAGSSELALGVTVGRLDNELNPTRGWTVRARGSVAGPPSVSAVEYLRSEVDAAGFIPLGRRRSLALRVGFGRLYPYGVSVPTPQSDTLALLVRLRDGMLSTGGSQSVRGWGPGLLGPKIPNFRVARSGDSTVVRGDHYIPFAGFARVSTSVELQFPFPFSESDHQSFVFLDGGRVWNADARFGAGGPDPLKQERFFWATGAGALFQTPAGPLRIALAYKLNPSVLDLRSARAVTAALLAGEPIESVRARNSRRFHLHLSIGQGF